MRQRLDALAGYLLNVAVAANWSRADVANILGVAPDSLRRRRYGFGDRKARWWPGTGDRRDRLPRVYREGDPKPDGTQRFAWNRRRPQPSSNSSERFAQPSIAPPPRA